MTWTSPPQIVTDFRDMLLLCASAVAAGLTSGKYHFPSAAATSQDATAADALPYAVLAEVAHDRNRYAEMGILGIPSGRLLAILHINTSAGTLEALGRAICSELMTQSVGLPIRLATCALAADPLPSQIAAATSSGLPDQTGATFRAININVDWGLSS